MRIRTRWVEKPCRMAITEHPFAPPFALFEPSQSCQPSQACSACDVFGGWLGPARAGSRLIGAERHPAMRRHGVKNRILAMRQMAGLPQGNEIAASVDHSVLGSSVQYATFSRPCTAAVSTWGQIATRHNTHRARWLGSSLDHNDCRRLVAAAPSHRATFAKDASLRKYEADRTEGRRCPMRARDVQGEHPDSISCI